MVNGLIIKSLSGFYYVKTSTGILTCRGSGKIKYSGLSPLVGDYVQVNEDNVIVSIDERKNSFIRPAVANVDMLVFVATSVKPVTDPFLIDRVSVIAKNSNCDFVICLNKTDLDCADTLYETYINSGFKVIKTSARTGFGIDKLLDTINGKISAFTGNSGVGKSSLLNRIIPDANVETDQISEKLGRGKHTTRYTELFCVNDTTYIADTPGYASFDIQMIDNIKKEELEYLFPEFEPFLGKCKFPDCRHMNEPDCALKSAVYSNLICQSRYESYIKLYDLLKNNNDWD